MPSVSVEDLTDAINRALARAGASPSAALAASHHLATAEAQGLSSHGASRTPLYCAHLRNGRAAGGAVPRLAQARKAACLVDAGYGMAFEACALATREVVSRAREFGTAFAGVTHSNHFGVSALHLQPVADAGLVGLAFSNSPAAIAPWGGKTPLFGTNPIAAVFPRRDAPPLIIDLSLSQVPRGKLLLAQQHGERIPEGWAVDAAGNPTTDPEAGLAGSMAPMGGSKGAMLALTVELLCCALTGAAFGFEADSFFQETGNRPDIGQAFLAIDPGALAGDSIYYGRVETLLEKMLEDPDVRLPGERRQRNQETAYKKGLEIPDELFSTIRELAGLT